MVKMGQLDGEGLVQLLLDVCCAVQPKLRLAASPGAPADHIDLFLRMVKFQPANISVRTPEALLQALHQARGEVVLEVLAWLVAQADVLPRRARVGWFLTDLPLPDGLVHVDAQAAALLQDIRAAQQEFIALDRAVDEAHPRDAKQLAAEMHKMQDDKGHLEDRKVKLRMRVMENIPPQDLNPMLEAARDVRSAREQLADLRAQVATERGKIQLAKGRTDAARAKMAGAPASSAAQPDPAQLIAMQRDRVGKLRAAAQGPAIQQMQARARRLSSLRDALASAVRTEEDLQQLYQQRQAMIRDVNEAEGRLATKRRELEGAPAYGVVRQQAQLVRAAAKKVEDRRAKLTRMQARAQALRRQVGEDGPGEPAQGGGAGVAVVSKSMLDAKAAEVRGVLERYRAARRQLDAVDAELVTLAKTQDVLATELAATRAKVRAVEAKMGVAGYSETTDALAHVSEQKAAVDGSKGQVLEEISARVADITRTVKAREAELAPMMERRTQLKSQLHAAREALAAAREQERRVLADAVGARPSNALVEEAGKYESLFHVTCANEAAIDADLRLVDAKVSTSGVELASLKDRVMDRVARSRAEGPKLEERVAAMERDGENRVGQEEVLAGLRRLLEAKLQARMVNTGGGLGPAEHRNVGGANVMTFG